MTYEQLKDLKPSAFKRIGGTNPQTFDQMVELVRPHVGRQGKRAGIIHFLKKY